MMNADVQSTASNVPMRLPPRMKQKRQPIEQFNERQNEKSGNPPRQELWRTVKNSASYVLPYLRPESRVLDCGCGTGVITADIARMCYRGYVVGMDSCAEIVKRASEEHKRARFVVGDINSIPFPDGKFDVVIAHQVLQYVKDASHALEEMRRVCKEGGIVAARDADYMSVMIEPVPKELSRWTECLAGVVRVGGGDPMAGRRLKRFAYSAGFTDVKGSASVWCFSTDEERSWWGNVWADRIEKTQMGKQIVKDGFATQREVFEMSCALRAWALKKDGWVTIVHGEIVCRV